MRSHEELRKQLRDDRPAEVTKEELKELLRFPLHVFLVGALTLFLIEIMLLMVFVGATSHH